MALRALVLFSIAIAAAPQDAPVEFVCPMDPDVRSKEPGKCPRCKMKLEAGLPDFVEYPIRIQTSPRVLKPGVPADFAFEVLNPKTGQRVREFEEVHERLFHLFYISGDLQYFAHEHPMFDAQGLFHFRTALPKAGSYRVLADFYPKGGTPQMTPRTIFVAGESGEPKPLAADLSPKKGENLGVELTMEPPQPIAGKKTLLFFQISPAEGLTPYLGAWGHMLAASSDLIDVVHQHPAFDAGGPRIQFNMIFPRRGVHRVWVQFQREGVVNTVAFNIAVTNLE